MTTDQKQWLAELLNRLDMVRWDRMTTVDEVDREWLSTGEPGKRVNVYGWIDRAGVMREDSRRDFIVVTAWPSEGAITYVTSSAEWSEEIGVRLYGAGGHVDCQRVEHELQGLVSSVIHL